jgi:Tol biopolymer transport system component
MDLWRIAATGGKPPERLTQFNRYIGYPTPIDARTVLYVGTDQDSSGPWLWALDVERRVAHRVTSDLVTYTSIAAAAGGRRLIASVASPVRNLWTVPILVDSVAKEVDVKPYAVPNQRALMPRFGGKSLFYLSSQGAGDGLWRFEDGQSSEIWKGSEGALAEPPAVSFDGRQAVIVVRRNGKQTLHLIAADGSQVRPLAETIDVRGSASWKPDGKWIVTGGNDGTGEGLFMIPVGGGSPVRLTSGDARNPVWSPTEPLIVYAGKNVAGGEPLQALRSDGSPVALREISLPTLGERVRFLPDGKGLIYMQGSLTWQDFWMLDLTTQKIRQLSHLNNTASMRTFDIPPDGKQIVFDRKRDNSDIQLIDLPR